MNPTTETTLRFTGDWPFRRILFPIIAICTFGIVSCTLEAEEVKRHNALSELLPTDLSELGAESRQKASDYIAGWMKAFSAMGTSGIKLNNNLEKAQKEILPRMQSLENGTYLDQAAYKAGIKVYDALDYLADRLKNKKPFDDKALNTLLRYEPGNESDPAKLSDGVGRLFFDFAQMVDAENFNRAAAEAKKAGRPIQ